MELLQHQIEDAAFLASKSFAGCFSGMGSGKTLTALEAVELVDNVSEKRITVIIGPPISLHMWHAEYERHLGYPAQIIKTGKTVFDNVNCYIMSYSIAVARMAELKALGIHVLICDESHALKTPDAKRTVAILGEGGLVDYTQHAWMLTGTPSTRYNDDLFSFLRCSGSGELAARLGKVSLARFRLRYCITQKRKFSSHAKEVEVTVGNRNTEELNDIIFRGGLAVRRELKDVWAAMPPLTKTRLQIDLDMSADMKLMMKDLKAMSMREVQSNLMAGEPHIATVRRELGNSKVKAAVAEIVERHDSGVMGGLLVGCWHTEVIDRMVWALSEKGIKAASLDGRSSSAKKQQLQEDFNEGRLDVLVGQIAAMGVSLNLQKGGSRIIVVEEDFSPATMAQFYARLHRMGQDHHVHVDTLYSDNKLDEAIYAISQRKAAGHTKLMEQLDD